MGDSDYLAVGNSSRSESKRKDLPQKITILVVYLIAMIINALAGAGKLGGNSVSDISNRYDTLITPPGYTFAIWGVIYFFLGVFAILQMFPNRILSQPEMFYALSAKGGSPSATNARPLDLAQPGAALQRSLVHRVRPGHQGGHDCASHFDFPVPGVSGGRRGAE